jgi:hypothetical protein
VPKTFFAEGKAVQFGKDDDAHVRTSKAEMFRGLQAIDAGHAEIEEDEIGLIERGELDGILAVTGGTTISKPPAKSR